MGLLNERLSHETKPLKSGTRELKQTVREKAVRTKRKAAAKSYERSEEHRVKECRKIQMDSAQINKKRFRHSHAVKTKMGCMIMACLYMIFLIYGVFVTEYQYSDKTGKVIATKMSLSDIRELKEYNSYLQYYRSARALYEKCLALDYRIAQGVEDSKTVAPEYTDLLDDISTLSVKIDAAEFSSKYTQMKASLLSWVKTDIAVYCQNIAASILQNDESKAQQALSGRETMYQNFSMITGNLVSLGGAINGAQIQDTKEWSPESYVENHIKSNHGK